MENSTAAIIVAGGRGERMESSVPKQFLKINGKEILYHTVSLFDKSKIFGKIVVVCHKDYISLSKKILKKFNSVCFVSGGKTRQESVYNGLMEIKDFSEVVIHDAVRCMLDINDLKNVYESLHKRGSSTLAVRVKDTIKLSDSENVVLNTVPRDNLWQAQTPQAFKTEKILSAHKYALKNDFLGTDDCSLMEFYGEKVYIIEGSYENIKITTPDDIKIAKVFMKGK